MARRVTLLRDLKAMVGTDIFELDNELDGWPGLARVRVGDQWIPVAVHVGPVLGSHRGRDEAERRFQNPGKGKPVQKIQGYLSLLVGVWTEGERPVVIGLDAEPRVGRETRQSLFISVAALEMAMRTGWAEYTSSKGERIFAFHPELFPTYVLMRQTNTDLDVREAALAIEAAGLLEANTGSPAERARRATTQLIRSATFRKRVVEAYGGRCAMCGFNFSMVEGAHIYPANAPGSPDEVWNGLALCGNHHTAFDRHRIWVSPETRKILIHPEIVEKINTNDACKAFVDTTYQVLAEPVSRSCGSSALMLGISIFAEPRHGSARSRQEMFEKRYDYFESNYDWAGDS